jgi:predicted dehydrogenase
VAFQFPRTQVEESFEAALAAGYTAAVIVTPVLTHAALAQRTLEAGLHVLIEKPLTHTVVEAEALIRLAQEQGRTLMAGHVFHYKPAVRLMAKMVQQGEIGRVCYLDSVRVNLGLFRHDVNVVWDLAPHDLTIFEALLGGRQPQRISVQGAQHVPHPTRRQETMTYLTLDYGQELLGHIHVNWFSPLKQRQLVVAGDKKMIVYDDMNINEPLRIYNCGTYDPEKDTALYPQLRAGDMHVPYVEQQEPLFLELQEFFAAIREGRAPETDGQAGLRIVRMLEAAMASLEQGGKLIHFS